MADKKEQPQNTETLKEDKTQKKPGLFRRFFGAIFNAVKEVFYLGYNVVAGTVLRILPKDARDLAIQKSYNRMQMEDAQINAKIKADIENGTLSKEKKKEREELSKSKTKVAESLTDIIKDDNKTISDKIEFLAREAMHTRNPVLVRTTSNNYIKFEPHGNDVKIFFSKYKDIDGIKKHDSQDVGTITFDEKKFEKFYHANNGMCFDLNLCMDSKGNPDEELRRKCFELGREMVKNMPIVAEEIDLLYDVLNNSPNRFEEVVNEMEESKKTGINMEEHNLGKDAFENAPVQTELLNEYEQSLRPLTEPEQKFVEQLACLTDNPEVAVLVEENILNGNFILRGDNTLTTKDGASVDISALETFSAEPAEPVQGPVPMPVPVPMPEPIPMPMPDRTMEEEEDITFNPEDMEEIEVEAEEKDYYTLKDAMDGVEPPVCKDGSFGRNEYDKDSMERE